MSNFWQGENVKLRAVELTDLKKYFCNGEEIDSESQRAGDRLLFPVGENAQRELVEELSKNKPIKEEYFLIIEDIGKNPIGNINSHSCNRINGTFEYGVSIRNKYRGKGYAEEAIKILLRFYFEELRYRKASVKIYSFNKEAIKLHEKLGFVLEGKLRKEHFAMNKYWDLYCYGMLREEFEKKYR